MKDILDFLKDLNENNNREWFDQNRKRYQKAKDLFEVFITDITARISLNDPSIGLPAAKDSIFRIFRDVRFSADKLPYKTNFGAFISNGGRKTQRSGYYIHIEPGASMVGGGIYMPPADVLKKLRKEIYFNADSFKHILNEKKFKKIFGYLEDFDKLKRPPKDFDSMFPDIELLKYKSYVVMHKLPDDVVLSDKLADHLLEACSAMTEFNHFLNKAFEE
ncbi:MAG: TIGR02453 family protein [Bacteroidetes bacterium HGW-Bacteroidetes-9]|jgi:uncharacterized protein (TIGR02453 family)|nr:MAG: TIGR02453 family protein [Bacteroidetes bacterium HGW-Bacteroidetes-9]